MEKINELLTKEKELRKERMEILDRVCVLEAQIKDLAAQRHELEASRINVEVLKPLNYKPRPRLAKKSPEEIIRGMSLAEIQAVLQRLGARGLLEGAGG